MFVKKYLMDVQKIKLKIFIRYIFLLFKLVIYG